MRNTSWRMISFSMIALVVIACAPQEPATPTVDSIGTIAAELASSMLTQTAAAVTPTPLPPTLTPTPAVTDTPTLEPTPAATAFPEVNTNASCYRGPGESYPLVGNISVTELVEFAGVAHVEGWYVIYDPIYGSLCWIRTENLTLDPSFDVSAYPTLYP